MSEHLSDLVLDEVMDGGPRPPHLDACGACRERESLLRTHVEGVRGSPHFSRARARALSEAAAVQRPSQPRASWFSAWLLVPALATLATVVVLRAPLAADTASTVPVVPPRTDLRVKGPPGVELLRLVDGEVNPVLHEGEEVALRLRSGGRRYALVVSMDGGGQVEALWPSGAVRSGELDAGQPAPLFQVTRGDFAVHAIYSETPLRLEEVRDWLATHAPECSGASGSAACQEPAGLPSGAAHAAVSLQVEGRP
ncbi:hypothetical protein JY651_42115 [Pyxidicoccus parkwayensis]|uniref:DUF4384 domain-containing protein n=1 Tax=Pyxidicoccus parkwayensis TaxID=2813578 RepID=A0ABX7NS23_9BACT|nr:hypothetical protein [Pyxidicoccus parkwaysis]QSQ21690.1 hypothetical protein JY651_42115 [Pyxidicoccus parkwaysis]